MTKDAARRRFELADRHIEVIDERLTGEVLLDEALKMMKSSEKMSVGSWIDLMSGTPHHQSTLNVVGETWNIMKIGYQLKQVRERLAKGLVDKGILRTEKRNFLLFDMATHPVTDPTSKEDIRRRVVSVLTARTPSLPNSPFLPEQTPFRVMRSVALVCAAYAANVLENALAGLGHETREKAFQKVDALLGEYSSFPFRGGGEGVGGMLREELETSKDKELQLEVVAAVLQGMHLWRGADDSVYQARFDFVMLWMVMADIY
jgi:golgi phosphoprotein 3